jgi:hypothetical protein
MALKPPVEVPQGAIRLNTDSQKLEFFAQDQWWQMATEPSAPIGGRGVYAADQEPGSNNISYVTFATGGEALDFGDLPWLASLVSSNASRTRGVFTRALEDPGDNNRNEISYVTIATAGNAADFGDLTVARFNGASFGNQTRGCFAGGHKPAAEDTIDYITFSSTGNAVDFGNLSSNRYGVRGAASPTRGMTLGGDSGGNTNIIEYVTIASIGNAIDFGDLITAIGNVCSSSNNITACKYGGGGTNHIESVTIATLGNAQDFGDTVTEFSQAGDGATATQTRGVFVDGGAPANNGGVTTLSQIAFATRGNAYSFGDLNYAAATGGFTSNCHGGL